MNRRIFFFFFLLIGGSAALLGYYFARPYLREKLDRTTSDAGASKGTITIGMDSWIGYFPLCSKNMRKRFFDSGYLIKCVDDSADTPGRMKKLASGELQFAVATVDSFILSGAREGFPGTIIMVIDESKGGDAIIAHKDKVANLEALKTKTNYKIAFTSASPSEHLLKAVSVHFDVPLLRNRKGNWKVEAAGSSEALKLLLDRKVDLAVLWEPDVSKALSKSGFVKLLGTEDTKKLIVDILVVNRDFSQQKPEAVKALLANYFRTLKEYRDNLEELIEDISDSTKVSEKQAELMLKGVRWTNLAENARDWFGVSPSPGSLGHEGLIDTIESTVQILQDVGDFSSNPLPQRDPYRLQHRLYIQDLFTNMNAGQFDGKPVPTEAGEKRFAALSTSQWEALTEVGTLKVRPVTFQSGTSDLNYQGKLELDLAAQNFAHYPNFRVVIKGHSGLRGDAAANHQLSQERSEAVKKYLIITHGIEETRLRAIGFGSDRPLVRSEGESDRAYEYRLPRVELNLVAEGY